MPLPVRDVAPVSTSAIAVSPALLALPVEPYKLAKTTAVRWDYILFFATLALGRPAGTRALFFYVARSRNVCDRCAGVWTARYPDWLPSLIGSQEFSVLEVV